MSFYIDNQTLSDLELFPSRAKTKSVFECYNCTYTAGGAEILNKYLRFPVTEMDYLVQRKQQIRFFISCNTTLHLDNRRFSYIEHYLKNQRFPLRSNVIDAVKDGILNRLNPDGDYYIIHHGIFNILHVLADINKFLADIVTDNVPESVRNMLESLEDFLNQKIFDEYIMKPPVKMEELNFLKISRMDHLFRNKQKNQFRKFLEYVYILDVFQSMARLVKEKKYSLTEYLPGEKPVFEAEECFHPVLESPVASSFGFGNGMNLCFVTGPNMSGKSTFLKTMGLLVYISHTGLPVPARRLKISVQKGLFTSINLADNINTGLSHFYAEVKRVKEMALVLKSHISLVVIFDELFKGTNVKDAFEATLLILNSLAQIKRSMFFISTHIIEVAGELNHADAIDYRCFKTTLIDREAVYDYRLKKGVSGERFGLKIIENEKVNDILENIIAQENQQVKS